MISDEDLLRTVKEYDPEWHERMLVIIACDNPTIFRETLGKMVDEYISQMRERNRIARARERDREREL